jgi:hypothetical protein
MRLSRAFCGALLLAALSAPSLAAELPPRNVDPLEDFDNTILRSFSIQKCHASQDRNDQAVMARVAPATRAAVEILRGEFDRINPSRRAENEALAKSTIDRRIAAHEIFIQSQVVEYGCDWLDGKAFPQGR